MARTGAVLILAGTLMAWGCRTGDPKPKGRALDRPADQSGNDREKSHDANANTPNKPNKPNTGESKAQNSTQQRGSHGKGDADVGDVPKSGNKLGQIEYDKNASYLILPGGTAIEVQKKWKRTDKGDVFVGDMIFPKDRIYSGTVLKEGLIDPQQLVTHSGVTRWPKSGVPYTIDGGVAFDRNLILEALKELTEVTGIRFFPRSNESDYIHFQTRHDDGFCGSSYIGRIGGRQEIYLRPDLPSSNICMGRRTIRHEIIHALGFLHTHQRKDRDEHVTVHLENVREVSHGDFAKVSGPLYGAYDTNSIMHYGSYQSAKGSGPSVTRKDGSIIKRIPYATAHDVAAIRQVYGLAKPGQSGTVNCSGEGLVLAHKSYIGYYGRCGDKGGLQYWCNRFNKEKNRISGAVTSFGSSKEYQDKFGKLSDNQLITNIFRHAFKRGVDKEGLNFYRKRLAEHRKKWIDSHNGNSAGSTEYALSLIAFDILVGAKGNDVNVLGAKVEACKAHFL